LLTIDPRVRAFQPQPFCVDLIDQTDAASRGQAAFQSCGATGRKGTP
jgi:hypothetical protein